MITINELDARVRRLDKELHAEQIQRKRLQRELDTVGQKQQRDGSHTDAIQRKTAEALALMSPVVDRLAAQAVGLEAKPAPTDEAAEPAVGAAGARRIPTAIRKRRFSSPSFPDAGGDPLASARRILEMNRLKIIRGGSKPTDADGASESDGDTIIVETDASLRAEREEREAESFQKALRQNELIREDIVLSARTLMEHISGLETEIREQTLAIDQLRADLRQRDRQIETGAAEADELRRTIAERDSLDAARAKQDEQNASYIEALNAQIVEHSQTVARLMQEQADKQKQLDTMRMLLENETLEAERYRQDYLKANNELNEREFQLRAEIQTRETIAERNAEMERRLADLEAHAQDGMVIAELRMEIDRLTAAAASASRARIAEETARNGMTKQYEKTQARLNETLTKLTSREQETASLKSELEQYKYLKKQAELQSVKIENMSTIERQLNAARSENAALSGRIAELTETIGQRDRERSELTARIDEALQDRARLNDAVEAAQATIETTEQALSAARSEIDALRIDAMARATDAEAALRRQIETLESERSTLASQCDAGQLKTENLEFRIADLEIQLEKHRELKADGEAQAATLRQSLADAETRIARMDAQMRELKAKLAASDRELTQFRDLSETQRKSIEDLKAAHEQSRIEISERLARYRSEERRVGKQGRSRWAACH